MDKTILLVIDGASYVILKEIINELPNIRDIANTGIFGEMESVYPALTPVALASLFTGVNPESHGVNGNKIFVRGRSISKPISAFSSYSLQVEPIWSTLSKHGYKVLVGSAPQALPDRWKLESLLLFDPYRAKIKGCSEPLLLSEGERKYLSSTFIVKRADNGFIVSLDGNENVVDQNSWVGPIEANVECREVDFTAIFWLKAFSRGVYVTPFVYFQSNWSNREEKKLVWENVFKRTPPILDGDYRSLERGLITFDEYLQTLEASSKFFTVYNTYLLDAFQWDFAIVYTPIIDNIQHLLYGVDDQFRHIKQAYAMVDNFVGIVKDRCDNLFLVSDHGIAKVKKKIHLNLILREMNLLHMDGDGIDEKKTKAYYGGGGAIRVNLRGRERNGVVSRREFPRLINYIVSQLERVIEDNESIFQTIIANETPAGDREGDITFTIRKGYAVSNTLYASEAIENVKPYVSVSGDHGFFRDEDFRGIVIVKMRNVKAHRNLKIKIIDIAPTILKLYNIQKTLDGKVLEEIFNGK
ncbi:nucleotide pyrophosphatase [Sulfolobales archaeon HS-7]|nr:nucleotide pyrophosphatase [Sulfolobales archaeon HS-7]